MAYLYRHIRLDKNEPFYIGIGSDSNGKYSRAFAIKTGRNPLHQNILNKTVVEVEILLDDLTWEEACEKEKEFIKLYGRIDLGVGCLSNMTNGGEGVFGKIVTDEMKNYLSTIGKLKIVSDISKEKNRQSHLGKEASSESKQKCSISLKKYYTTHVAAHKGKPSWNKGIPMSDAARKKLTGRVISEETKQKQSASAHKRPKRIYAPVSNATKEKIRITLQKTRALKAAQNNIT